MPQSLTLPRNGGPEAYQGSIIIVLMSTTTVNMATSGNGWEYPPFFARPLLDSQLMNCKYQTWHHGACKHQPTPNLAETPSTKLCSDTIYP